ncbi:hypothetical protein JCGZ_12000 [Jatropha curcas]|uniref:VQ domain-containing protein n=1 Tax=Jatropha curcas TaxID=180498 RepID=A0A067KCK5_JATCU|nr:hypothetical protein JCGZ_12000 [Jatropha curcas]
MSKKLISKTSSSRICKNHPEKKKQFNNILQVLRPKVYITDVSNFKRLVQELTGNGCSNTTPTPLDSQVNEQACVSIVSDFEIRENSLDLSFDSLDSHNQMVVNKEINQSWNQIYQDASTTFDNSLINENVEFSEVQEMESWLLDMEPCRFDNGYQYPQFEQELSAYDYQLLGDLM